MSIQRIIGGVHASWAPFLYYELLSSSNKDVVCVVDNNRDISYSKLLIQKIDPNLNVFTLPEYESEKGEKAPFDFNIATARARCLFQILNVKDKKIIITTQKALLYLTCPVSHFQGSYEIKKNHSLSMSAFQKILLDFGYKRFELTEKPGQFSLRGGIIDLYPITEDFPCRIDFFGNIIESIKLFDAETQKTISERDVINITKASEIPSSADSKRIFKEKYPKNDERIFESLEEYGFFNGMEWFLPYFFEEDLCEIYKYLNPDSLFVLDSKSNFEIPKNFEAIKTQQFEYDGENFAVLNNFNGNVRNQQDFSEFLLHSHQYRKTIISMSSNGALNILQNIFKENNFSNFEIIENITEARDGISIIQTNLTESFVVPSKNTVFYTEKQLFGYVLRTSNRKKSASKFFKNYSNLIPGNYVVHKKHGIAIFEGLETINVSGINHDFLCLVYKNNDKLFVPVENIDMVSRYGNEDGQVEIDKLGGTSWKNRHTKVHQKLLIIANNLLKIAAKRKLNKVEPMEINVEKYDLFCKKFPYIETDDQDAAINDVINDLKGNIPMDRLICGDVGFGKTEIALRGAFAVADSGRQVVLLAPTTILVNQHYKTFLRRFEGTGIEICQLSRFSSRKDLQNNISRIEKGEIQIIIGTHTILSPKIKFNNLGMLIIDEEQHFGVKQKEFIKSVKNNVHVMTMTATPIPRTLQMAISGIRDLSIIASPPMDRLPVKTYVSHFEEDLLKKAVMREISRGGQVFIVSPRVEFIDELYSKFSQMFPKNIIQTVHGKTANIEEIITDFCDQKIDILISTNIIDSGIDIQNANTIIVHRTDMFGLSQLYQLRGRVGRLSKVQGYCYMLLSSQKKLTSDAEKRLNVIQNLNTLGSGFTLASHDLDIRGAGNIVGDEQSGHIRDVGIELYQKMLEGAILMKDLNDDISPQINIGIPVLIPDTYIEDKNLRMTMYRRIGDINTLSEINDMELELADRFGQIPQELYNLLEVIKIKIACVSANIDKIDVGKNGIVISFYDNKCQCLDKLLDFVSKNQEFVKIRPDHKLIIQKKWKDIRERTRDITKITELLGRS